LDVEVSAGVEVEALEAVALVGAALEQLARQAIPV